MKKITLDWYNGVDSYDLRFVDFAIKENIFDKHSLLKNIVFDNKNMWYKFKKPLEHEYYKGYYYIPYFTNYIINRNGDLFSLKTLKVKKPQLWQPAKSNKKNIKGGYKRYQIVSDANANTAVGRHRLLALTFLEYNNNPKKLMVNHINGVPGDDRIENLEWVSPRDNLIHALKNNLMPNSVKECYVINFNMENSKPIKFNSIAEAAKYLNWTHSKARKRISAKYLNPDGIIISLTPNINIKDKKISSIGSRVKVESYNTVTGERLVHNSIMDASSKTGVNTTSISECIKSNCDKKIKTYYFKKL